MTTDDRALLGALLGPLAEAIEQVSLPLHLLLEHRFGELNDNQLEMIEAARDHAERADRLLRQVKRIRALAAVPVDAALSAASAARPLDLVRAPLALAQASASSRGVQLTAEIPPDAPRVRGDRGRLEEALTLILGEVARTAPAGAAVTVELNVTPSAVALEMPFDADAADDLDLLLADLVLRSAGATLERRSSTMSVQLPRAG